MHQAESSSAVFCLWTALSLSAALHPRLSTTQLPSATDRPVFLSDEDFQPIVVAYSQAHFSRAFGAFPPAVRPRLTNHQSPFTFRPVPGDDGVAGAPAVPRSLLRFCSKPPF
jgi:hypothetical protein